MIFIKYKSSNDSLVHKCCNGIVETDFKRNGKNTNNTACASRPNLAVHKKAVKKCSFSIPISHITSQSQQWYRSTNCALNCFPHSPYSPDLSLPDLKRMLQGKKVGPNEQMIFEIEFFNSKYKTQNLQKDIGMYGMSDPFSKKTMIVKSNLDGHLAAPASNCTRIHPDNAFSTSFSVSILRITLRANKYFCSSGPILIVKATMNGRCIHKNNSKQLRKQRRWPQIRSPLFDCTNKRNY